MKLRTWGSPLVTFLSGENTVILKNREEIEGFVRQMKKLGIDCSILLTETSSKHFETGLLVEYNNAKGTTWWNGGRNYPTIGEAIQASQEWFGTAPLTFWDICII